MLPLYPRATFIPADRTNISRADRTTFSKIIFHITDGRSRAMPVARMWQEPKHGSSAHFVIDQDGSVIQAVQLKDIAWHAHAQNKIAVGIEHCARSPKELEKADPGLPLSPSQYEASAKLTAWLCHIAGLTPSRQVIQGHAEADPKTTHRDCPTGVAGGLDWDKYMALVQDAYRDLKKLA